MQMSIWFLLGVYTILPQVCAVLLRVYAVVYLQRLCHPLLCVYTLLLHTWQYSDVSVSIVYTDPLSVSAAILSMFMMSLYFTFLSKQLPFSFYSHYSFMSM